MCIEKSKKLKVAPPEVPVDQGVIIGMVLVFIYATLGGMRGITYTQAAQYVVDDWEPVPKVPAAHAVHVTWPTRSWNLPALHGWQ